MKTNKLSFTTNFEALNEAYIFLRFTWQQDNRQSRLKWANSHHLDELLENYQAEACLYRYGQFAYVMFKRQQHPDSEMLRQKIASSDEYAHIKVDVACASEHIGQERVVITGAWLYQLLFNALANSTSKRLVFHNLNGNLIYFPMGKNKRKTVVGHEIVLENNLVLTAKARTYQTKSKIFHEEKDENSRKKKLAKPAYQFHLSTLKRVYSRREMDWSNIYIQAGVEGTKATSDAINIKGHQSFLQSRMGILHTLYSRFNERYHGVCTAKWNERPYRQSLEERFRLLNNDDQFKKIAAHLQVRILDKIASSDSQKLAEDIQLILAELGIDSKLGKREYQGAHHLCLVKPKSSYSNRDDDPYRCDQCYITQHLTDEKYRECLNADMLAEQKNNKKKGRQRAVVLKNLLKELWIKQDVNNHHIHLFNKDDFVLLGNWVFGMIMNDVYHMLEVSSEGKLAYFCDDRQMLFPDHPYQYAIDLLDAERENYKKEKKQITIEAFMISPDRDVNMIMNEKEHALPNLEQIESELLQGEAFLPEQYVLGTSMANMLKDLYPSSDKNWSSFIDELNMQQSLTKNTLNKLIKKYFHTSTRQYKTIRNRLLQHDIILGFSKAKKSIFNKMGDLFSIRTGEIDECSAWYSVGYYYASLQQSLPHMVNLRVVKSLKGRNLYQDILPLLDVDFVRYNNITVLPFPMKYLREMIAVKN